MTGVIDRAAGFFLAPAERSAEAVVVPPVARAVVLGSASDAPSLAAALAVSLRAAAGAPAAVVATWGGGREIRAAAAGRAAARLAARLTSHELHTCARGRLAWLELPAEPAAAADAVRRASALVDGPLVTALGGARPRELDDLVAEHDLALVAAKPETALARAALARLAAQGIGACAASPLHRGLTRTLALAGLAAPRLESLVGPA
jgi:hypothetical protein